MFHRQYYRTLRKDWEPTTRLESRLWLGVFLYVGSFALMKTLKGYLDMGYRLLRVCDPCFLFKNFGNDLFSSMIAIIGF
jgi:hypothetical protein